MDGYHEVPAKHANGVLGVEFRHECIEFLLIIFIDFSLHLCCVVSGLICCGFVDFALL